MLPVIFSMGCHQLPDVAVIPELGGIGPSTSAPDGDSGIGGDSAAPDGPPGVLLVVLDDLGYGDTSLSALTAVIQESDPDWSPDIPTPALEAFSAEGLSLTAYRTDAPVCAPTRAALMTGLQPHAAGLWSANTELFGADNQLGLRPGLVLLPERLQEAGVATALVGKWHLGEHSSSWDPAGGSDDCLSPDTPDQRGFDTVFGFLSATHDYHIDDGCSDLLEGGAGLGLSTPGGDDGCPHVDEHTTEVFTEHALARLDAMTAGDDPWFLTVAYNAPHDPVDQGAAWIRDAADSSHPDADRYAELIADCDDPGNRTDGSDFCLLTAHLDLHLGRLLDAAPDNALVIVMSDNGGQINLGASNAHLRGEKGNIFNGGTMVPLLVRGPDIPVDAVSDAPITTSEFFPTVLDFFGIAPPEAQDVTDFPTTCSSEVEVESIPLVAESRLAQLQGSEPFCRPEIFQENNGQVALLWQDADTGTRLKLMADFRAPGTENEGLSRCEPNWMLFDQSSDMAETDSLIDDEPELAEQMIDALGERVLALPYSHSALAWHTCCFSSGGEDCEEVCGECYSED